MPEWLLLVMIAGTSFLNGWIAGRHQERRALVKSFQPLMKALEEEIGGTKNIR